MAIKIQIEATDVAEFTQVLQLITMSSQSPVVAIPVGNSAPLEIQTTPQDNTSPTTVLETASTEEPDADTRRRGPREKLGFPEQWTRRALSFKEKRRAFTVVDVEPDPKRRYGHWLNVFKTWCEEHDIEHTVGKWPGHKGRVTTFTPVHFEDGKQLFSTPLADPRKPPIKGASYRPVRRPVEVDPEEMMRDIIDDALKAGGGVGYVPAKVS